MLDIADFPETPDIETSSDDYALRFTGKIGSWFLKVQEEATLRMLEPHSGAKILDVGGGHGQLTNALIENNYNVTILGSDDVCSVRIRDFIKLSRCEFKVGNILNIPYQNQSFDIVLSYRLIPHVNQWKRLLVELARVAKIAVIVDYPSLISINYMSSYLFEFKKRLEGNTRPFSCFKENELLKVFKQVGFERAERYPEFLLPMVIHRALDSPTFSLPVEKICRLLGLTRTCGSPVILKVFRLTN